MLSSISRTTTSVVLLYHRMGLPKLSSLVAGQYVAPNLFRSQLDYLSSKGWAAANLESVISNDLSDIDRFAITFDDGYLSVYEHAYPALVEHQIKATIYVVVDSIGGLNEWDRKAGDQSEPMMSAEQIKELSNAGFEIGSHTLTHPHLTELNDSELKHELVESKNRLEDLIGKPVKSFSYPYGDCDDRVIASAIEAGYSNAVTTKLGIVWKSSAFEIPRVNVRWNAFGPMLMRKIGRAKRACGVLD
ncbi:MAG: polysaccharide deacetylase family protein [Armatimonadota bacterium]